MLNKIEDVACNFLVEKKNTFVRFPFSFFRTKMPTQPPRFADRLLEWFCASHLLEEVQGDLYERFQRDVKLFGERSARRQYFWSVLAFFRPFALKKKTNNDYSNPLLQMNMIRNYFKIAFRNLLRYKGYSLINILGLTAGMTVAMLIGLWIYDEMTFDHYHENHDRIAQVMQHRTMNGEIESAVAVSIPVGEELSKTYPADFDDVVMSSWITRYNLAFGDNKITRQGNFMSPAAPDLLSLKMTAGTKSGLKEQNSILLSTTLAKALFGDLNPIDKIVKVNNKLDVKVTGIYEDLPYNTTFRDVRFILPWDLLVSTSDWIRAARDNHEWSNNSFRIFVKLSKNADADLVSEKIRYMKKGRTEADEALSNPEISLHPMNRWHLYSEWKNGLNNGGRIQFVWLFGAIGVFVLILACINFMNLSTARSEKRAKEVGIRKAVGSLRGQLITQFFTESLLISFIAFTLSLVIVWLSLSVFNDVADKQMNMLWSNPYFWMAGLGFTFLTGLLAGSYPAFYLSSFQPLATLKGTFKAGRFAAVPRKVLVVTQFTVSIVLIIGTAVVYKQILFAKNRPIGYDRNGLVSVHLNTKDIHKHFEVVKDELIKTGTILDMAESASPATDVFSNNIDFDWEGKDPAFQADFATIGVSHDFGNTVGWKFADGRDFSKNFSTDSAGFVLNETAVKFMGLKDPVGKTIRWEDRSFKVIGVIKDMLMSSPFEPVKQTIYFIAPRGGNFVTLRIHPHLSADQALKNMEAVFKKHDPSSPFTYDFVDDEYEFKFAAEEQIGKLAAFFSSLAIFISCLGLFGLSSFVAEQRTKEIGVRKVLGASVFNLWSLLSRDFVILVFISLCIAVPVSWYYMEEWLQRYIYRTSLSWWIFALTGAGALLITLLTISFQSIKAAMMNPVKSLKSE